MRKHKKAVIHSALALAVMALSISVFAATAPKSNSGNGSQSVIVAYKAGNAAAVRRMVLSAGGEIVRELGRASAFAVRMPTAGLVACRPARASISSSPTSSAICSVSLMRTMEGRPSPRPPVHTHHGHPGAALRHHDGAGESNQ